MAHGKQRSVDASRFAMDVRNDVPRSAFDVQFMHKTTFNAAYLIPVYVEEVLPGDSFRLRMTAFCRTATAIVPVMDNLILESFFFFVPNRLLWENWKRFMGEQLWTGDAVQFLVPQVELVTAQLTQGSIFDYLGLTLNNGPGTLSVSALPLRAYNRIWQDWFRDEDIAGSVVTSVDDGPDITPYTLKRRGKRKDYFTSCRPWPEKTTPASIMSNLDGVLRPGGPMSFPQTGVPVSGIGVLNTAVGSAGASLRESGTRFVAEAGVFRSDVDPLFVKRGPFDYPDVRVLVNDIRTAGAVQQLLERHARGGTRYTEIVRSHFGVLSPDSRLQRPEFLGGGRANVTVHPIAQTSASGATGTTTVLGEQAGIGTAIAEGHGFSSSFTEHGWVLGLVSVRADLTYQQGVDRMWYRRSQYDYYWPAFANLGEQAVLQREIYADGSLDDILVFGYQERWSEYKYRPSRTSGAFRSSRPTPLDIWHFGQQFVGAPVLNEAFIQEDPPVERVLQVGVTEGEQFLCDALFDVRMVRPMPMRSIPGVGGRL